MRLIKILFNRVLGKVGYGITKISTNQSQKNGVEFVEEGKEHKTNETSIDTEVDNHKLHQSNLRKRLRKYIHTNSMVKIHFGCGPRVLKNWINIDLSYEPFGAYLKYYTDDHYPEHVRGDESDFFEFDVTKGPIPIPDESVDVIFHEDFFEHISQRDQVAFLAETHRILKKGGIHRINTPDLVSSMKVHSDFSAGFKGVYFKEWDDHMHLNVITKNSLKELALMTGYKKIIFNHKDGSISKEVPKEYRPDPNDRPIDGNVYADLVK